MSWFSLNEPFGSDYAVDPEDIVNTKTALSDLGYYEPPEGIGIQPWTDNATFDGIKNFQQDNDLKVDGFMRPGGPTEKRINQHLAMADDEGGGDDPGGDKPDPPIYNMPEIVPPNIDPNMPVLPGPLPNYAPGAYIDEYGNIIVEGINPRTGQILPPIRGI